MRTNKLGQVTIFILIAIILVAGVIIYFALKKADLQEGLPANIEPIYTTFLSCLEEETLVGIDVLESQAGYISLPDFEPGSAYMPFSSHLNFLGNPLPYWYYVSGNNIVKEQLPSKRDMEEQLAQFLGERLLECDLTEFEQQGYEIDLILEDIDVGISANSVRFIKVTHLSAVP